MAMSYKFPRSIEFTILAEDVAAGKHSCDVCPVATGVRRTLGEPPADARFDIYAQQHQTTVTVAYRDGEFETEIYKHSWGTTDWIRDYDRMLPAARLLPFTARMELR